LWVKHPAPGRSHAAGILDSRRFSIFDSRNNVFQKTFPAQQPMRFRKPFPQFIGFSGEDFYFCSLSSAGWQTINDLNTIQS
jgi:hypothetical protein